MTEMWEWARRLRAHWDGHDKIRFLAVGAYNTLFGYAVFALLYLLLARRIHYLWIVVMSHVVSVSNAFLGHKFLTFKARGHWGRDFFRFNLTYLGTLAFALAALPAMVEAFGLSPLVGQAVVVVVTTLGSYVLHKHVSFDRKAT